MSVLKKFRPQVFCTHWFGHEQNKAFNGLLILLNYTSLGTTGNFSFGLEKAWASLAQKSCPLLEGKKKLKQNLHCAHLLSRVSVTPVGHLHTYQIHSKNEGKQFARHFFLAYRRQYFHFKNQKAMKEPLNNK